MANSPRLWANPPGNSPLPLPSQPMFFSMSELSEMSFPEMPATEFEDRAGLQWKDDSMTAMTEAESLETDTGMTVVKSLGADELINYKENSDWGAKAFRTAGGGVNYTPQKKY